MLCRDQVIDSCDTSTTFLHARVTSGLRSRKAQTLADSLGVDSAALRLCVFLEGELEDNSEFLLWSWGRRLPLGAPLPRAVASLIIFALESRTSVMCIAGGSKVGHKERLDFFVPTVNCSKRISVSRSGFAQLPARAIKQRDEHCR